MKLRNIAMTAIAAATVGFAAVPSPVAAQVYFNVAPPPARVEVMPAPRSGWVWVPGYWDLRGHRHHWVPGHWERERRGYRFSEPRWVERDGRWYLERPRWHRGDRDRDGVPNRYDRDRDGDGVPNRRDARPNNPYRS